MESFNQPHFGQSFSNSTSPSDSTFNSRPSLIVPQSLLPEQTRTIQEKKQRKPRGKKLFSDEKVSNIKNRAKLRLIDEKLRFAIYDLLRFKSFLRFLRGLFSLRGSKRTITSIHWPYFGFIYLCH